MNCRHGSRENSSRWFSFVEIIIHIEFIAFNEKVRREIFHFQQKITSKVQINENFQLTFVFSLRYYPVLASLQLRNVMARFFAACYMLADISYAMIREGYCMGFLPLSRYYSTIEEAKLRMVRRFHLNNNRFKFAHFLGTWHMVHHLRSREKYTTFHILIVHRC